jgi:hypothetical protein
MRMSDEMVDQQRIAVMGEHINTLDAAISSNARYDDESNWISSLRHVLENPDLWDHCLEEEHYRSIPKVCNTLSKDPEYGEKNPFGLALMSPEDLTMDNIRLMTASYELAGRYPNIDTEVELNHASLAEDAPELTTNIVHAYRHAAANAGWIANAYSSLGYTDQERIWLQNATRNYQSALQITNAWEKHRPHDDYIFRVEQFRIHLSLGSLYLSSLMAECGEYLSTRVLDLGVAVDDISETLGEDLNIDAAKSMMISEDEVHDTIANAYAQVDPADPVTEERIVSYVDVIVDHITRATDLSLETPVNDPISFVETRDYVQERFLDAVDATGKWLTINIHPTRLVTANASPEKTLTLMREHKRDVISNLQKLHALMIRFDYATSIGTEIEPEEYSPYEYILAQHTRGAKDLMSRWKGNIELDTPTVRFLEALAERGSSLSCPDDYEEAGEPDHWLNRKQQPNEGLKAYLANNMQMTLRMLYEFDHRISDKFNRKRRGGRRR